MERPYSEKDVEQLRGSVRIEHTLATLGAERLWELLNTRAYVNTLGALTGGQAGGRQRADVLLRRDQHLAAHVAALLLRRQLILEVDARDAGLDHRLRQFEHVQRAAEARLAVRHDRGEPVRGVVALGV